MQDIQRQSGALAFFRRVMENGRLGHAYAITGPEGVNKTAFAIELAKALLCPVAPNVGCGTCLACQRVESHLHPDLHVFAPLAGKREIGIDAIRGNLIPTMSLTPFEAKRKVFILESADWMTEEAADCLLKTLEEPPPSGVLLLLTESADLLQPTIRSRCQVVRLAPAPPAEAAKELAGRFSLTPDQAMTLARLADGSLERASAMQETGWQAERDAILRAVSEPNPEATLAVRELVEGATASAGRALEAQRSAVRQRLLLLLLCCRDLLVGGLTQSRELLVNRDASERILQVGSGTWPDHWLYLAEDFIAADDAVLANANLGLLLDLLFQRLSK